MSSRYSDHDYEGIFTTGGGGDTSVWGDGLLGRALLGVQGMFAMGPRSDQLSAEELADRQLCISADEPLSAMEASAVMSAVAVLLHRLICTLDQFKCNLQLARAFRNCCLQCVLMLSNIGDTPYTFYPVLVLALFLVLVLVLVLSLLFSLLFSLSFTAFTALCCSEREES